MATPESGLTTREKVRTMTAAGIKTREIATALNLSTQRVNKIKAVLKAIDEDAAKQEASA
jgi:DNA-binding CsgD family transcriptional regulator